MHFQLLVLCVFSAHRVQLVSLVLKASVGLKDLRVKLDQQVLLAQLVLLDHQ